MGKARQLTRSLQRQLEDELDVEKNLGINPDDFKPENLLTPRDDDTFSPLHDEEDEETPEDPVDVGDEDATDDKQKDGEK